MNNDMMKSKNIDITPIINMNNVETVRSMINRKNSSIPFKATINESGSTFTDFDNFPYNRFYRGVYYSPYPVVIEREAGFRPRRDDCYQMNIPYDRKNHIYPNHCFESACSVVYPCYPPYLAKVSDKEALNVILNKACTVQYR